MNKTKCFNHQTINIKDTFKYINRYLLYIINVINLFLIKLIKEGMYLKKKQNFVNFFLQFVQY